MPYSRNRFLKVRNVSRTRARVTGFESLVPQRLAAVLVPKGAKAGFLNVRVAQLFSVPKGAKSLGCSHDLECCQ